ncbi:hypothetical protein SLEP1_g59445 [Rubroshorea leprosula]|uniref:Uncharacterized protein n=1 Tax=Rubroshorea leprosula TaxID=152421 RepID=A0AAV5MSE9_9ROSI|nr:hypothetical protein SLEP1_g59445 [Rubroshorea leprosula]
MEPRGTQIWAPRGFHGEPKSGLLVDSTGNPDLCSSWIPRGTQIRAPRGFHGEPRSGLLVDSTGNPVSGFPKEVRMMKTMAKNDEDDAKDAEEDKVRRKKRMKDVTVNYF